MKSTKIFFTIFLVLMTVSVMTCGFFFFGVTAPIIMSVFLVLIVSAPVPAHQRADYSSKTWGK